MKKKIFKKKSFWIVSAVILLAVISAIAFQKPKEQEVVTSLAEAGRLVQSVSATGQVASGSGTNLNPAGLKTSLATA